MRNALNPKLFAPCVLRYPLRMAPHPDPLTLHPDLRMTHRPGRARDHDTHTGPCARCVGREKEQNTQGVDREMANATRATRKGRALASAARSTVVREDVALTHTNTRSLSLTHTHSVSLTHTHTLGLSLSHTHTHSGVGSAARCTAVRVDMAWTARTALIRSCGVDQSGPDPLMSCPLNWCAERMQRTKL